MKLYIVHDKSMSYHALEIGELSLRDSAQAMCSSKMLADTLRLNRDPF